MTDLFNWINTHGVMLLIGYAIVAGIVGSIPPLPENAGFWAKWGYAALHGISMNLRTAWNLIPGLKSKVPELPSTEKKD